MPLMLEKLTPRERLLVVAVGGFFILGLLFFLGLKIVEQRDTIHERVVEARDDVQKMKRLRDQIRAMPASAPLPDENEFLSKTTAMLDRLKLQQQSIRSIREPGSAGQEIIKVEIIFNLVSMKDIIALLHAVEFGREVPARVSSLDLRKPLAGREVYEVKIHLAITKPRR
jgi:type II secretory pathway component PulM